MRDKRSMTATPSHLQDAKELLTQDGFKTGEYREDDKSIPILLRNDKSRDNKQDS